MESGISEDDAGWGREVVTVSQLNRAVAGLLTRGFRMLRVRGEIANFTRAASGHWYFTLKDAAAQVRCVMFRGRNSLVEFAPREGDQVELLAQVGLYEPRGEYQLTVEALQSSGIGQLYERFLRLKNRLEAEGLFAAEGRRPLPPFPRSVGVVTSLAAAALHDVLATLGRRSPQVAIVVYPVPVQGEGAGARIAEMLATVSRRAEVDVILLVRGGGSIEDLWAFNEEVVARAIRACSVPVVVGVGHESDYTIADFAADVRAPTPTAAAELAAPDRAALLQALGDHAERLRRAMRRRLQQQQQRLDYGQRALAGPLAPLQGLAERLRAASSRTAHAMGQRLGALHRRADELRARFARRQPRLEAGGQALQRRTALLARGAGHLLQVRRQRVLTLAARLQALDPRAVLSRGYALATDREGRVVTDAARLAAGELLDLQFARGRASTQVLRAETFDAEAPSPPRAG